VLKFQIPSTKFQTNSNDQNSKFQKVFVIENWNLKFIKVTPENPVLWTGMKGVSAKGRKNLNQMLKRA
jgi:hypothetical protein